MTVQPRQFPSLASRRFHIRNAAGKLHVNGRSQAIHRATTPGYIGAVRSAPIHTI